MDYKQRYKRVRLLVSELNKHRRMQGKKIDILCNDFIEAQKEFIARLRTVDFAANFYQAIIGKTDLNNLLDSACRLIRDEIGETNIVFFLRNGHGFESHIFESEKISFAEEEKLENCFSPEIAEHICKSNKGCTLDEILAMGTQINLAFSNKLSACTVPLGRFEASAGFILFYRQSKDKLTCQGLNGITAITEGLSRAIQGCLVVSRLQD